MILYKSIRMPVTSRGAHSRRCLPSRSQPAKNALFIRSYRGFSGFSGGFCRVPDLKARRDKMLILIDMHIYRYIWSWKSGSSSSGSRTCVWRGFVGTRRQRRRSRRRRRSRGQAMNAMYVGVCRSMCVCVCVCESLSMCVCVCHRLYIACAQKMYEVSWCVCESVSLWVQCTTPFAESYHILIRKCLYFYISLPRHTLFNFSRVPLAPSLARSRKRSRRRCVFLLPYPIQLCYLRNSRARAGRRSRRRRRRARKKTSPPASLQWSRVPRQRLRRALQWRRELPPPAAPNTRFVIEMSALLTE